jgi:hypothetical protein
MKKILIILLGMIVVSILLTNCSDKESLDKLAENTSGNSTKCLDYNNDGVYDACTSKGTGHVCRDVKDCEAIGGCVDFTCVPGGVGKLCITDKHCVELLQ